MKKNIIIVVAILVGAALGFAMVKQSDAKLLQVNEIGTDPAAYTGTITFTGVMGGISQADRSVIGVMDLKELQCTSPNCNKIMIPVRCQAPQPALGDEIKVTGTFKTEPGGFMFVADSVKVVRNHKIGG